MTWAQFKAKVISYLTTEGTRLGVADLRTALICAGARDLQQFVRRYQEGNKTTLNADDFTLEGEASLGTLPTRGIKLNDCYVLRLESVDFTTDDIADLAAFAGKLKADPADAVSAFILTQLSSDTQSMLTAYPTGDEDDDDALTEALVADLNSVLHGSLIYTALRFAGVTLRDQTQELMASDLQETFLDRVNRLLIEDAYTSEITQTTVIAAEDPDNPENIKRFPIKFDWPWEDRYELVSGDAEINDQNAIGCIDPYLKTFYIYPAIESGADVDGTACSDYVELHWDGVQWDTYADADTVPFDDLAALAVSYYVRSHLVKETEPGMSEDYMRTYIRNRLNLYLN